jgi:predicted nucleic acid-binding protein
MVFVDTSVWIDYFSGHHSRTTRLLLEYINSGQSIYSLPVIVQEILQGLRDENHIVDYIAKMEGLDFLSFDFQDSLEAARMYRTLRKQGVTPSTIDIQIARVCVRDKLQLLTEDRDFIKIAKKFEITLI